MEQQHIVIIGGGFAGLNAVRYLRNAPVRITLIDRRNHHLFQPLLYQVATGELSPADIAAPLRGLLKRQENVRVLLGEVNRINASERYVRLSDGQRIDYDKLIVAAGTTSNYFGSDHWQAYAPGLKSIEDAVEIRRRILRAFEYAERHAHTQEIQAYLTFVVIGGGPTGVELAGALAEIAHQTFERGFHSIKPADSRIILIQSSARLLPTYHPDLSAHAAAALQRMGVEVMTNARVTDVSAQGVTISTDNEDHFISTFTPLWAVGVQASPLGKALAHATGATLDRGGRVIVAPDCSIPGHPDIFVVGDLAHFAQENGEPLPGVAQVAIQQGKYVARLIERSLRGKTTPSFRYLDWGNMATIGRGEAVTEIGRLRLSGFVAWKFWLFIHLMYQVSFESRVLVFIQWLWKFITRDRSALLMVDSENPSHGAVEVRYATDTGTWPVVR